MKAIILIELDEKHLPKQANDLYDRLKGYKCELTALPPKLDANDWHRMFSGEYKVREAKGYGWNACIDEILGGEK